MNFRHRFSVLSVISIASLSAGAQLVACSSSSTTTSLGDGGGPNEAGTHDSGKSDAPTDASGDAKGANDAGSDTSPPTDAPASSDAGTGSASDADLSACTTYATAECAIVGSCNKLGLSTSYGDGGNCVARLAANCVVGILASGSGNTAASASVCAAALPSELARDGGCIDYLNGDVPDAACTPKLGTSAVGSGCSENAQCATGYCATPTQSACGTCATTPAVGASCLDLNGCGSGLVCYKGSCAIYTTEAGGTCSADQPCGASLSCVIATDGGTGTCEKAAATTGAACDPTLQTGPGCYTQAGYACIANKMSGDYKTCQPIAVAAPGGPCGSVDGIIDNCGDLSTCFKVGDAGRQCVARAADNAACNTVTGPACMPPARCLGTLLDGGTSGTCTARTDTVCP